MTKVMKKLSLILLLLCSSMILLSTEIALAHGTNDKTLISPVNLATEKENFHVLDLRSLENFNKGHIPGAFSLPLEELSEKKLQNFGVKSDDWVVLYGVSESSAQKGKLLMNVLNYQNIKILAGGFTHWQEDGQTIELQSTQLAREIEKDSSKLGLQVIPETYDFGLIQMEDGVISKAFTVKNISTKEISIVEITTSCGCTKAEIDAELILPGEFQTLLVYFDPNFHEEPKGKFSRTVFLQTTNNQEAQVKIEVEIVK